nr:MAG TPA: hypothetical protein [Caudoviricetes sp.]
MGYRYAIRAHLKLLNMIVPYRTKSLFVID